MSDAAVVTTSENVVVELLDLAVNIQTTESHMHTTKFLNSF